MLVTGFPAGMFQTNCYILAQDNAKECVVVDPGQDAAEPLIEFLTGSDMTPRAVLLTHGHLDHVWSAQAVADRFSIPTYIHPDDRHMLSDPGVGLGSSLAPMLEGTTFTEPHEVIELADGDEVEHAGIKFVVDHTPGHTQLCRAAHPHQQPGRCRVRGRTDRRHAVPGIDRSVRLPGGNHEQLLASIAAKLLVLDDTTAILPGHGGSSTIGQERASNPFLVGLAGSR